MTSEVKAPPQVSYRETMGQAVRALQEAWAYKAGDSKAEIKKAYH